VVERELTKRAARRLAIIRHAEEVSGSGQPQGEASTDVLTPGARYPVPTTPPPAPR